MAEEENTVSVGFPLFKPAAPKSPKPSKNPKPATTTASSAPDFQIEKSTNPNPDSAATFADLGLADWVLRTCDELGMKKPTAVQSHCIPEILAGRDVLGIAQTGSGKTAAFALPILQRLSENPFGVFALVVTPTRELAYQLAEQFRALGASLHLRCSVVVGGMDSLTQTQSLTARPHVVIATPGRIKVMLGQKDIRPVFSNTKVTRICHFVFVSNLVNYFVLYEIAMWLHG